jgi:hypothetical protein
MSLRALPIAVLAAACAAAGASAPAHASFAAPVELAHGSYATAVAAATDAAGTTTAAMAGITGGTGLAARPRGGSWAAPQPFPAPAVGVAGPVVAAAGDGALALAWRVDRPRKFSGIAVAVRDPDGTTGPPQTIADDADGGVRYPAVAVDRAGRALLAYNTGTRSSHLSLRGGIAVALRAPGQPFQDAAVVDPEPGTAPAVALAADGRGVVAWTRQRRVYAVAVDVGAGRIGVVEEIARVGGVGSLVGAAGPGGAATVAWVTHRSGTRRHPPARYRVGVAGRRFARPVELGATGAFLGRVALAADEDGTATLAWSPERFGGDRTAGINGVTSMTLTATAAPGRPFGTPRLLVPRGDAVCGTPTIAAAAGRTALAWTCMDRRGHVDFQAAVGDPGRSRPQTISTAELGRTAPASGAPSAIATLDAQGTATILLVRPDPPPATAGVAKRILAATGDRRVGIGPERLPR